MSFWPLPDPGSELMVPSTTSAWNPGSEWDSYSHNNPNEHIREDFGTLRTDYNHRKIATLFPGAYTIDDGNSLIPLADPLFASYTPLRMQVFSLQETHIFSPAVLNTVTVGFSRASFSLASVPLATFDPCQPFLCHRGGAGRDRRGRRSHNHRQRVDHFRRPEQRGRRRESQKSFYLPGQSANQQRNSSDQRWCLVPTASGQRRQRFAPSSDKPLLPA